MAMNKPRFEVYRGNDDQYYWRLKAVNGKTIATGGEGYRNPEGAQEGVFRLVGIMQSNYYDVHFEGVSRGTGE